MKFRSKIISSLVIVIISINFFIPTNAYAYRTQLDVQQVQQQKNHWCWAASSQMVANYLTNSTKTQREIVKYVKYTTGNSSTMYPDTGGNADEMVKAVKYATNNIYKGEIINRALSYDEIKNQINHNKPIICSFSRGNSGHAVVIYGYDTGEDGTEQQVFIMDPWRDSLTHPYTYEELITYIEDMGKYYRSIIFGDL